MTRPLHPESDSGILESSEWRQLAADHERLVDELTADHRARAAKKLPHPVEDFLFTYYSLRPSQLRRWYPGAGTALLDAPERAGWRFHRSSPTDSGPAVSIDIEKFRAARGELVELIRSLLVRTESTPGQFGCFGMHEWAMVYRAEPDRRHPQWPLRLGGPGTDAVVEAAQIRCSHHDAFRFFTAPARPLNLLAPAAPLAERTEQPGCMHATMDLYKWAYQLAPLPPSSLLVDCFLLAREIREVDMRASPYDLAGLGYSPIAVETAAGKVEYVAAQRSFAQRGQLLRRRLLSVIETAGC